MSNHHSNHHKKSRGLNDKQQGMLIGAGIAAAVTTPITILTTRRAMKAEWLENREKLIAAQKNTK